MRDLLAPLRRGFFLFAGWVDRHQWKVWLAMLLLMVSWVAYDAGNVVARSAMFSGMVSGPQGSVDLNKALELASESPGGRLIVTGESSALLVMPDGKVWRIPNFGGEVSRDSLVSLRTSRVNVEGNVSIGVDPVKSKPGDLIFTALANAMGKLVIILLYGGLLFFGLRMVRAQGVRFNRIGGGNRPKVKIGDVAGQAGAKKELFEIVEYLRSPDRFERSGARPSNGVLLYGPPGTGKTLLAKAVAGEANAMFLEQSASSFVQIYAGAGAKAVRDLFAQARKERPCVIFIDELDAVGGERGGSGSHGEREQTLIALLTEMDGFEDNAGIVVIAATNRLEVLDPALVRPGRFDRKVYVSLPGRGDRLEILSHYASRLPDAKIDLEHWANQTAGFSGADLAGLVNEAAVEAARANRSQVNDQDMSGARDRIRIGVRDHGRIPSDLEREYVAHHEIGHAFMQIREGGRVEKVSILPRAGALGNTIQVAAEEKMLITAEEIRSHLRILMGGRASEQVFFGQVTSGAADDMQRASDLARRAVRDYGFGLPGEEVSVYVASGSRNEQEVDRLASAWVTAAYSEAVTAIEESRDAVSQASRLLLQRDELDEQEICQILLPGSLALPVLAAPADSGGSEGV